MVNALWAGGAEAMVIMDIRVISTSAVRCVGNTLLLHGRVFSPPFEIKAIGDPGRLRAALDADAGVRAFREAARSSAWAISCDRAQRHRGSGVLRVRDARPRRGRSGKR